MRPSGSKARRASPPWRASTAAARCGSRISSRSSCQRARFDGVFANASLFHVPRAELPRVLRELHACLKPRGVLFSSNPRGRNEEGWSAGRYGAWHDLEAWRGYLDRGGLHGDRALLPSAGPAAGAAGMARERVAQVAMSESPEKDSPLTHDIRLLGRVLGDTIRHYEGERTFRVDRGDPPAGGGEPAPRGPGLARKLAAILDALTTEEAVAVVRAFSYFSLLANIAEDRHHIRRYRDNRRAGAAPLRLDGARPLRRGARARRHARGGDERLRAHPRAPGAHRASHGGAAQEHARLPARHRRMPARAWTRPRCCPRRSSAAVVRAAPAGGHALADAHAARREAGGARRDRERARLLPLHLHRRDPGDARRRSRIRSPACRARRRAPSCRRSCASAAGWAATATAIPSSPPRCSRPRSGARARSRSTITWAKCTRSAPSCRSRGCSRA